MNVTFASASPAADAAAADPFAYEEQRSQLDTRVRGALAMRPPERARALRSECRYRAGLVDCARPQRTGRQCSKTRPWPSAGTPDAPAMPTSAKRQAESSSSAQVELPGPFN